MRSNPSLEGPTISLARNQIQLLIDGENVYMATVENLKARKWPSDTAAATNFILEKIGDLVDYFENAYHLRTDVG